MARARCDSKRTCYDGADVFRFQRDCDGIKQTQARCDLVLLSSFF